MRTLPRLAFPFLLAASLLLLSGIGSHSFGNPSDGTFIATAKAKVAEIERSPLSYIQSRILGASDFDRGADITTYVDRSSGELVQLVIVVGRSQDDLRFQIYFNNHRWFAALAQRCAYNKDNDGVVDFNVTPTVEEIYSVFTCGDRILRANGTSDGSVPNLLKEAADLFKRLYDPEQKTRKDVPIISRSDVELLLSIGK
jgi:hypothetical protein